MFGKLYALLDITTRFFSKATTKGHVHFW